MSEIDETIRNLGVIGSKHKRVKELLKWQKINFYLKLVFYLLVLAGLLYAGFGNRGADPCNRCKFSVNGAEGTCRELIYNWSYQCFPDTFNPPKTEYPNYTQTFANLNIS